MGKEIYQHWVLFPDEIEVGFRTVYKESPKAWTASAVVQKRYNKIPS